MVTDVSRWSVLSVAAPWGWGGLSAITLWNLVSSLSSSAPLWGPLCHLSGLTALGHHRFLYLAYSPSPCGFKTSHMPKSSRAPILFSRAHSSETFVSGFLGTGCHNSNM